MPRNMKEKYECIREIGEFVFGVILVGLIVVRVFTRNSSSNWIWLVNYISLFIAMTNIFVLEALFILENRPKTFNKYKGLTALVILVLLAVPIIVGIQKWTLPEFVNDLITLLALLFCLVPNLSRKVLHCIVEKVQ